jgi:hypothetical protein
MSHIQEALFILAGAPLRWHPHHALALLAWLSEDL